MIVVCLKYQLFYYKKTIACLNSHVLYKIQYIDKKAIKSLLLM